jgi:Leucine-rich repeat (LRR) protein
MPDESLPLVPLAGSQLARHGSGGGRILDDMVSSALTTSQKEGALIPRYRIGDIDFCEPDYRQMLLWAEDMEMTPEEVLLALWNEEDTLFHKLGPSYDSFNKTYIREGRLKRLYWNFDRLLIYRFDWLEELELEAVEFVGDALTTSLALASRSLLSLDCMGCGFEELDLRSVPALQYLWCTCNQLAKLDLHLTPSLKSLDCSSNKLTELDLGNSHRLEWLDCSGNEIYELDFTRTEGLKTLLCSSNQIEKLDIRSIPDLQWLDCSGNAIKRLDLCESESLQELGCDYNLLTELDLSGTTMLRGLSCIGNELEELDIRPLQHLESLTYDRDRTRLIQRPDQNF